jgi:hypothetical protein
VRLLPLAVAALALAMSSTPPPEEVPSFAEGVVLVKFRVEVPEERQAALLDAEGMKVEKKLGGTGILKVRLPEGLAVPDAVRGLSSRPEVEFAEPDYLVRTQ